MIDGCALSQRPEFVDFEVDGATLGALRWPGIVGAPTLVAVHGITSNAWAWDPLAHHLAGAAHIVAVDLRGRSRSFEAPGPYGIAQHADDIATRHPQHHWVEAAGLNHYTVMNTSDGAALVAQALRRVLLD